MSNVRESDWCFHCDKHVAFRIFQGVFLCSECNKTRSERPLSLDRLIDYLSSLQHPLEGEATPYAKSTIEALETFEIGSTRVEEGERIGLVCAVCKDAMVMGEIWKKLPCGHSYHGSCILPWLETRNSCPVCRFQLRTDNAGYEWYRAREEPPVTAFAGASSSSSMRGREENEEHHVVETLRRSTRKRKPNRKYMD